MLQLEFLNLQMSTGAIFLTGISSLPQPISSFALMSHNWFQPYAALCRPLQPANTRLKQVPSTHLKYIFPQIGKRGDKTIQVKGPSAKSDLSLTCEPHETAICKPSAASSVSTLAMSSTWKVEARNASSPSLGDPLSNVTTKIILIKVEAEKSKQPLSSQKVSQPLLST